MRHPCSRAERRHNRVTTMARRRKIIQRWYDPHEIQKGFRPEENTAWYSCSKWNLNCTCRHCRRYRFMDDPPPRAAQLRRAMQFDSQAVVATGWRTVGHNGMDRLDVRLGGGTVQAFRAP